jgi:hypothetical protein
MCTACVDRAQDVRLRRTSGAQWVVDTSTPF